MKCEDAAQLLKTRRAIAESGMSVEVVKELHQAIDRIRHDHFDTEPNGCSCWQEAMNVNPFDSGRAA